jgi:hypothetical protein
MTWTTSLRLPLLQRMLQPRRSRIEKLSLQPVRLRLLGKKVRSISSAKAKAAKAGSKVDKLCTKLAEATKGTAVPTPPGCSTAPAVSVSHHFHPHKKCKGILGSPSPVQPPPVFPQPSPQQKTVTMNKRVSTQSFLRFPLCSPEDLSSSESSTSSSGDKDKILLGKVTNDKIKTPFINCRCSL